MTKQQTPLEYLSEKLRSERDFYQKQADRLRANDIGRAGDREVIEWSLNFVVLVDRILAYLAE